MKITQPHHTLIETIRREGFRYRESFHVVRRLRSLLPDRLKLLSRKYRPTNTASTALKLAANDNQYHKAIDEYVEALDEHLRSKINAETHRMLMEARQSIRVFYRPS